VSLSDDDLGLLRFESRPWRSGPAKAAAIIEQFGCTPVRYYQRLNQLVDTPAAHAAAPLLVGRLRRIRDRRAAGIHGRRGRTSG
jgi:hypothetical protein